MKLLQRRTVRCADQYPINHERGAFEHGITPSGYRDPVCRINCLTAGDVEHKRR